MRSGCQEISPNILRDHLRRKVKGVGRLLRSHGVMCKHEPLRGSVFPPFCGADLRSRRQNTTPPRPRGSSSRGAREESADSRGVRKRQALEARDKPMMGSSKFMFLFLCNSVCSLLRVVVRLERRCVYAVGYLSLVLPYYFLPVFILLAFLVAPCPTRWKLRPGSAQVVWCGGS